MSPGRRHGESAEVAHCVQPHARFAEDNTSYVCKSQQEKTAGSSDLPPVALPSMLADAVSIDSKLH